MLSRLCFYHKFENSFPAAVLRVQADLAALEAMPFNKTLHFFNLTEKKAITKVANDSVFPFMFHF